MPARAVLSKLPVALMFAVALHTSAALADSVYGTRSELLVEKSHTIAAKFFGNYAELTVRRTLHNGGPRHDQAKIYIDLPAGAVATNLRTLGTERGQPHWFDGDLMEAEAAAAKYKELTGVGGYYPKDPALLSWRDQSLLALQVFPCPPGQDKTIEYTLTLPAAYRGGAFHVELHKLGTDVLTAGIVARAADSRDRLLVRGKPAPLTAITPDDDETLDFALVPHAPPVLGGELVTVPFDEDHVLTRVGLRASPTLSEVPQGARVVVALDASLSTSDTFVDRAKVALDAYLSHFVDAEVEVLTFDRKVERRFSGFVPVDQARQRLASLSVQRRNGSDVDSALLDADRLLRSAPPGAARRVLLLTDGLARDDLTPERLRGALGTSGALAHIGLLGEGEPSLKRDDDHPWASGLRPNGGLVWHARAPGDESSKKAESVFEEWARPVRIDRLHVFSEEFALQSRFDEISPTFAEGQGFEDLFLAKRALPLLRAEGELWTAPVRTKFVPDAAQVSRWSALVFGSPVLSELSEEQMMTLALRGKAVSPVTSYLAIEPGVRPSTEGLEEGASGFGEGFGRAQVRVGMTSVSGRAQPIDREEFLRQALRSEWRRCGGQPESARLTFQTTGIEIVAINDVTYTASTTPLDEHCLTEAVWSLMLPPQFDEEWNVWTIEV